MTLKTVAGTGGRLAANNPPDAANNTVNTSEATTYVLTAADIGFTDVDGDHFQAVKVVTLPSASIGVLFDGGNAVGAGASIPAADIINNLVRFIPATSPIKANGAAQFVFKVQDDGGTAVIGGNTGVDLDPTANTLTINVTPINDPPTGGDGAVPTNEDVTYTFKVADFTNNFADPLDPAPGNSFAASRSARSASMAACSPITASRPSSA